MVDADPYSKFTSFWDEIADIRWVKEGEFYDLHVPGPEHYSAHGLWHHNSGKTLVGAMESFIFGMAQKRPGQFLIGRYDWDELVNTTWKTFIDIIPDPIKARSVIKQRPLYVKLPNGFEYLGYNLKRHQKMASLNLSGAWLDEVNEDGIEEDIYLQLLGRLRKNHGYSPILLTGNPGGKNWVYQRFFKHKVEGGKPVSGHEGFYAGTEENKHLPAQYIRRMKENFPQEWLDRYFSGDLAVMFTVFEGQILDNFDAQTHVVPAFRPPDLYPRYRGLDHGIASPTACLWMAADYDGNLFIYREYYTKDEIPANNARAILAAGGDEQYEWTVIDPATQSRDGTGITILEQYRQAGLFCQPGDNPIPPSIARLKSLLQPDPEHVFPDWHPRRGEKGAPYLYIGDNCPWLKWEMENWRYKDLKPGKKPRVQEGNDHAVDALRYLVMRAPARATARAFTPYDRFKALMIEIEGESQESAEYDDPRNLIGASR